MNIAFKNHAHLSTERYAEYWCSLLISPNSTFTQCHTQVDPETHYKVLYKYLGTVSFYKILVGL